MHDLQHRRYQLRQHPLAHRHMGDDVVHQMGGGLCHATGTGIRVLRDRARPYFRLPSALQQFM